MRHSYIEFDSDCERNKIYDLLPHTADWLASALLLLVQVLHASAVLRTTSVLFFLHRTTNGNNEPA